MAESYVVVKPERLPAWVHSQRNGEREVQYVAVRDVMRHVTWRTACRHVASNVHHPSRHIPCNVPRGIATLTWSHSGEQQHHAVVYSMAQRSRSLQSDNSAINASLRAVIPTLARS